MCEYISEEYPDINAAYDAPTSMFKFNELLSLHPRSFFNLQNVEKVIKVLRKFKNYKQKLENQNQEESSMTKAELENEEKQFCINLWEIKKKERVETDYIRDKCFNRISGIIRKQNNFDRLKSVGNINEIMNENKPFHGLEDIQIQGEYIFQNGNTNGFMNIEKVKGTTVFAYKSNKIIDAIEMADKLDERFKCRNLSDFQSIIEILTSFESFNKKRKALKFDDIPKEIETKELHEKIHWWLEKIQIEQGKQEKFKFGNALKALHHWFKHPEGFQNLEQWYQEMNNFFNITDYEVELGTQNGEYIGRRYKNDKYFGVYSFAHEDAQKNNFVTTFWYTAKTEETKKENQEKFVYNSSKVCGKYLIITDTEFGNFSSNIKYVLDEKITVKTVSKSQPNFLLLAEQIDKGLFERAENVETLLLFLKDTVKNENIKKIQIKRGKFLEETKNYEECLKTLMKSIKNKFACLKNIILCYVDNMAQEKVNDLRKIESEICKLKEIDEFILEDKDAAELKEFLESAFTLEKITNIITTFKNL
uniref:Uncharacterized protein n=1 Tax=Panagrolaimus sp. ES5 TaxID=591445 RepID=A0AC34FJZ7_9BILA